MAGVTFPVGEGISMSAGYRFLQTQDFEYSNGTDEFVTDLTLHNVDLSLQFHL
jgi:opacity protein-like surface antigen